jgi:hypothetical protein
MTIQECLDYLIPGSWNSPPAWLPDAFGVSAYLLQKSGAYTTVVAGWPPSSPAGVKWTRHMRDVGLRWRHLSVHANQVPPEVQSWWDTLIAARSTPLRELPNRTNKPVCEALLQLVAAADEGSTGIGLPGKPTDFEDKVRDLWYSQTKAGEPDVTVCTALISTSKLRVLPKSYTPQSGMTVRSLSHNLALCSGGEVSLQWWRGTHSLRPELETDLNLLLVPWPTSVAANDFSSAANCPLQEMPASYGFFDYNVRGGRAWPSLKFERLLEAASELVGKVDGVVMPELALRQTEVTTVWNQVKANSPNSFLIAGVGAESDGSSFGENRVTCVIPIGKENETWLWQDKHHRWLVDDGQVRNYGLFRQLSPQRLWWENANLKPRRLRFIALTPWLSLCCLICEDLARQDPISDLIRSVGPNLVVALLMDGPQLKSRWPARYATVLADDPGCSVLTLTSIGMARLCKPFGTCESRIIALWKDSRRGPFEIELPYDASGIVLCLHKEQVEQWTADGRSDDRAAASWVLNAVHPVALDVVW